MRALVICQDPDETAIVSLAMARAGLNVIRAHHVPDPLPNTDENALDLIVLAGSDGTPLPEVKKIRGESTIPLLVICDPVGEALQVVILESGADLLIVRPYSTRLLIAQSKALLRRVANLPFFSLPTLSAQDVELDPSTRTVVVAGGNPKRLTQLEFRLLYTLMMHREQVLPTDVLVEQVWGYSGEGEKDLVRGLVRRLRSKIEPDPHAPQYVTTVPGVGYTFSSLS